MMYFKFWRKRSEKASSRVRASSRKASVNEDLLGVDLFAQLAYMAAISESGVGRSQLFEYASHLPYTCSKYFKEVHFLAQHLHYDYAQACGVVGQGIKQEEMSKIILSSQYRSPRAIAHVARGYGRGLTATKISEIFVNRPQKSWGIQKK